MDWKAFALKPGTTSEGIPRLFTGGDNNELTGHMKASADAVGLWDMRHQAFVPSAIDLQCRERWEGRERFYGKNKLLQHQWNILDSENCQVFLNHRLNKLSTGSK